MMPVFAILSTIDTVLFSAAVAPSTSFSSSLARMALSAVLRLERICRLCSRRLMFWRFALRADFVRLATVFESFSSYPSHGIAARSAAERQKTTDRRCREFQAETVG